LIPAFVSKDLSANVFVDEFTYLPSPITLDVKSAGKNAIMLYPNNVKTIDVKFVKPDLTLTNRAEGFGKIYFKSAGNETEYELPIYFKY
jgi:hypothetical protein